MRKKNYGTLLYATRRFVITEKALENNFVAWCKDLDIVPIKGPTATSKGFPDRFLQLPTGGGTIYVEFKGSSYYSLTPLQEWWRAYLKASCPNRYFLVEDKRDLDLLKQRCLSFIAIGADLVKAEVDLLLKYEQDLFKK